MSEFAVVLADRPGLGRVQLCGCYCVLLSIGPVTLNLDATAFAQVANLVWNGMNQLSKMAASGEMASDSVAQTQHSGHLH